MFSIRDLQRFHKSIRDDPGALDTVLAELDQRLSTSTAQLRASLRRASTASVFVALAELELRRNSAMLDSNVEDTAGQCRHLRGLLAAGNTVAEGQAPSQLLEEWLRLADLLWGDLFLREMLPASYGNHGTPAEGERRERSALMALLAAMQTDIAHATQAESHCVRVFEPLDQAVLIPSLGLSASDVVGGMRTLWEHAQATLNGGFDASEAATQLLDSACQRFGVSRVAAVGRMTPKERVEYQSLLQTAYSGLRGFLEVTEQMLPDAWTGEQRAAWLELFSFRPGTINAEYTTPFQRNEVRERPLMAMGNGRYLLIDPAYGRFAPLRALTALVETSSSRDQMHACRDRALEVHGLRLLRQAIAPSHVYSNYYIRQGGVLAEQDHLLIAGAHAFVVECKAGLIRNPSATRGNVVKLADDLKRTVSKGIDQCDRAVAYLQECGPRVPVLDCKGQVAGEADLSEVAYWHPVVVLEQYVGFASTDLTMWLDRDPSDSYPWVVDQYTLETILLGLNSADLLARYLAWRGHVHGRFQSDDEACFAGYFLSHGPETLESKDATEIMLGEEYCDIFDELYFRSQGIDVKARKPDPSPSLVAFEKKAGQLTVTLNDRKSFTANVDPEQRPEVDDQPQRPRRFKRRRKKNR